MTVALKSILEAKAAGLGLDPPRVMRADAVDGEMARRLANFLELGRHGDMQWMEIHAERRGDPRCLWPEVRSIVMTGLSYAPGHDPLADLAKPERGVISVYAQGRDYHDVLKSKLKALARALQEASGGEVKVFVDTAPLMEKPLAAASGVGWQGKHTNLVSRRHGSWLFLGAILTTAEIAADAAERDHCGSCRRCLDICPTKAFPAPYQLDARRCISYLTIEHKGHIDAQLRPAIGNRIFGCDDCLAACPWNKFAEQGREARLAPRALSANPPLAELLELDDAGFRARFAGSPLRRTGRDRFLRNVLIAAGNSGDAGLTNRVAKLVADPSPLVRAMAVWAMRRLASRSAFDALCRSRFPHESDPSVRVEWSREAET